MSIKIRVKYNTNYVLSEPPHIVLKSQKYVQKGPQKTKTRVGLDLGRKVSLKCKMVPDNIQKYHMRCKKPFSNRIIFSNDFSVNRSLCNSGEI